MQIKATTRYLTPVRMTVIKKRKSNMLMRMWGQENSHKTGGKRIQPLWKQYGSPSEN